MPPSASNKSHLSPAELAQLEHAFATDPTSDAYKPLAEAYLSMGRFMEAMVVCKKGVKAHPEAVSARVLLAKVYAEQGKDKKALEELQGALAVAPNDLAALRMAGGLMCKTGDVAGGTERIKKALAADPKDPETIELCKKHGVELPAPPPPPVVAAPPPSRAPSAQSGVGAVAGPGMQAPMQQSGTPQPGFANAQQFQQRPARPRPPPRPAGPPISYEELASKYEREDSVITRRKNSPLGVIITVGVILASALALGGYAYYRHVVQIRDGKIAKLIDGMKGELSHDSFASYKKACEYGKQIVSDLDPSLFSAHAYLAYAYAIRWGEHGEDVQESAKEHLAKAKAANQDHSHIAAAEAYIRFFGGDAKGAEDDLEKIVEDATAKGKQSALLLGVLGILEMRDGDLEKAYKNLKAANNI